MQSFCSQLKREGKKTGFVPTMGYLHEGHLSLVREAKKVSDTIIVSIFVNPTQFAPSEDLAKYPRDIEKDKVLLISENVDVLFLPEAEEIYPQDFQTYVNVQEVTRDFEGEKRPHHFKGVTTIVAILFNIVKPDCAVFGQKDAQQAAVIIQMVIDLKYDIKIIVAPIVREPDGLAMSSRNVYLSEKERKEALVLHSSLNCAESMIRAGERNTGVIVSSMMEIIKSVRSSKPDYIKIVSFEAFTEQDHLQNRMKYYILIACYIGSTRLIDNTVVEVS